MPDETSTLRITATLPKGGQRQVTRDGGPSLAPGGDIEVTHAAALAWLHETLPEALSAFRAQAGIPDPVDEQAVRAEQLTRTLNAIRAQIPIGDTSLLEADKAVRDYVAEVAKMRTAIDRTMEVARESIRPEADFSSLEDSALPGNVAEALQRANDRPVIPPQLFETLGLPPSSVPPDEVAPTIKKAIATQVATGVYETQREMIGSLLDAAGLDVAGLGSTAMPLGKAMEALAGLREQGVRYKALLTALGISDRADTDVVAQLSDRMRNLQDEAAMKARIKLLAVAGLPQPSAMSDERAAEALRSTLATQARRGQAEAITALLDAADADEFNRPTTLADAAELITRLVSAPTCSAHGRKACGMCSRSLRPPRADGSCPECGVFGPTGMHWDTCANRDRSPIVQQIGTYTEGVEFAMRTLLDAAGLVGYDADGSMAERLAAASSALRAKVRSSGTADADAFERLTREVDIIRRVVRPPSGMGTAEYLERTLADLRASAENRDLLATYVHAWINVFGRPALHGDVDSADPKLAGRSLSRLDQAIRTMIAANGEAGVAADASGDAVLSLTSFAVRVLTLLHTHFGDAVVSFGSLESALRDPAARARALEELYRLAKRAIQDDNARSALRTIASVLRLPQDAAPALVAEKFSERTRDWLDDAAASDAAIDALNELRDILVVFLDAEKLESVEDYDDAAIVRIAERALLAERWPVGTPVEVNEGPGWMLGRIGAIEVFEDVGNPVGVVAEGDDTPLWFPVDVEIVRASAAQARRMAGREDETEPAPPVEVKELLDEVGERLAVHAEKLFGSISKAFDQWPGGKR